jgi:hypothetical protein
MTESNLYLVIQKGFCIFGQGNTPEAAVECMKKWVGIGHQMQTWTVDTFKKNYDMTTIGEFCLVQATDEILEQYQ